VNGRTRRLALAGAFKLEEIDRAERLLPSGDDRGGSRRRSGRVEPVRGPACCPEGRVIALDVLDMPALPGVEFIQGDFSEDAVLERLQASLGETRSIL